jgi:hypothetical protein
VDVNELSTSESIDTELTSQGAGTYWFFITVLIIFVIKGIFLLNVLK